MDNTEEPTVKCENCEREIPESKSFLHESYCRRNVIRCPKCNEPVDKSEMENHEQEMHKLSACKYCKKDFEVKALENHVENCTRKPRLCEFCNCDVNPDEYANHKYQCGSRTKKCPFCNKNIMIRDYDTHEPVCEINKANYEESFPQMKEEKKVDKPKVESKPKVDVKPELGKPKSYGNVEQFEQPKPQEPKTGLENLRSKNIQEAPKTKSTVTDKTPLPTNYSNPKPITTTNSTSTTSSYLSSSNYPSGYSKNLPSTSTSTTGTQKTDSYKDKPLPSSYDKYGISSDKPQPSSYDKYGISSDKPSYSTSDKSKYTSKEPTHIKPSSDKPSYADYGVSDKNKYTSKEPTVVNPVSEKSSYSGYGISDKSKYTSKEPTLVKQDSRDYKTSGLTSKEPTLVKQDSKDYKTPTTSTSYNRPPSTGTGKPTLSEANPTGRTSGSTTGTTSNKLEDKYSKYSTKDQPSSKYQAPPSLVSKKSIGRILTENIVNVIDKKAQEEIDAQLAKKYEKKASSKPSFNQYDDTYESYYDEDIQNQYHGTGINQPNPTLQRGTSAPDEDEMLQRALQESLKDNRPANSYSGGANKYNEVPDYVVSESMTDDPELQRAIQESLKGVKSSSNDPFNSTMNDPNFKKALEKSRRDK